MKKVVYSVTKLSKDEKVSGIGYLADGDLLIPAMSSKNKPYIKVFEGVEEKCHLIPSTTDEYKGYMTVGYSNVHVFNKKANSYDLLDYIEVDYAVWYKVVD
jgi:hypothetical protein